MDNSERAYTDVLHAKQPGKARKAFSHVVERDYRILEILASNGHVSQRDLARQTGISHGLANIIVRRFIRIGWIKAKSVDGRRLRYFLTPTGLNHVMKRSRSYIERTMQSYRDLKRKTEGLVDNLIREGKSHFIIVGEGDIPQIVEDTLKKRPGVSYETRPISTPKTPHSTLKTLPHAAVLDCRWKGRDVGVSVLHELLFKNHS